MKVTKVGTSGFTLQKENHDERWPSNQDEWRKLCGLPDEWKHLVVIKTSFSDNQWIGDKCVVEFGRKTDLVPSRAMIERWANQMPERHVIQEFWDWLEKRCTSQSDITEMNIDKLLDEYHGIDRKQLDNERRALLEEARKA